MLMIAIASLFGLSVVSFLLVARSAPVLNEDGTFETAPQHINTGRSRIL